MSTLSGLLLNYPTMQPFDLGRTLSQANQIQGGRLTNETALLQLAELKRAQASEAEVRQFLQQHPELLLGGGQGQGQPMPILARLNQPGAGASPGAIQQQPFGPGGVTGSAQQIPAPMQPNANLGGPPGGMPGTPQGTIAGLEPQPQAPQQHPLMELMRRDPNAALAVQQRMQQHQEVQFKLEERRLDMGVKVSEAIARQFQGVTDQASMDAARERVRLIHPQAAAQIPQFYSKEAIEGLQERGMSVVEAAKTRLDNFKVQIANRELQLKAANIPNYTGDANLDAAIYERMKGQPPGTMPGTDIVAAARKDVQEGKITVAERTGAAQEAQKPLGETQLLRFNTLTQAEDTVKKLTTEFTPEERARFVGLGGMRMTLQQAQQAMADATNGKGDPTFARFAALVALAKAEAFSTAGKALTETESGVVYGYIPTGKEYSAEEFEQKLKLAQERVSSMLDRELKLATTPRSELPGMRARGELGASPRQTPAATGGQGGGKVLTEADIATTMQKSGKSRQEVLDAARSKGYTLPSLS